MTAAIFAFLYPEDVELNDEKFCAIEATGSIRPVFVKDDLFFIRAAALSCEVLDRGQMEYIKVRWV